MESYVILNRSIQGKLLMKASAVGPKPEMALLRLPHQTPTRRLGARASNHRSASQHRHCGGTAAFAEGCDPRTTLASGGRPDTSSLPLLNEGLLTVSRPNGVSSTQAASSSPPSTPTAATKSPSSTPATSGTFPKA